MSWNEMNFSSDIVVKFPTKVGVRILNNVLILGTLRWVIMFLQPILSRKKINQILLCNFLVQTRLKHKKKLPLIVKFVFSVQPPQFLFHKKCSPQDLCIITLVSRTVLLYNKFQIGCKTLLLTSKLPHPDVIQTVLVGFVDWSSIGFTLSLISKSSVKYNKQILFSLLVSAS